jgi:hypothetical protein
MVFRTASGTLRIIVKLLFGQLDKSRWARAEGSGEFEKDADGWLINASLNETDKVPFNPSSKS